jgi:hypothetical protein
MAMVSVCLSYLSSAIYDDTTEVRSKTLKSSSDIDSDGPSHPSSSRPSSPTLGDKEADQIPCNKDSSISAVGGFYHLKKFHFVGGLPLLQDMILYIASSTLEDISITIYQQSQDLEAKNMREAAKAEMRVRRQEFDQEIQLQIEAMEKATRIEYNQKGMRFSSNSVAVLSKRRAILEKAENLWHFVRCTHSATLAVRYLINNNYNIRERRSTGIVDLGGSASS